MNLKSKEKSKLLEDTCSTVAMEEFIIDFINGGKNDKLKVQKPNNLSPVSESRKMFLLVLDNLEGVITKDPDDLKEFLSRLHHECSDLKVLISTYRTLGDIGEEYCE